MYFIIEISAQKLYKMPDFTKKNLNDYLYSLYQNQQMVRSNGNRATQSMELQKYSPPRGEASVHRMVDELHHGSAFRSTRQHSKPFYTINPEWMSENIGNDRKPAKSYYYM